MRSKTEGLPQSLDEMHVYIYLHMGFHTGSNGSVVPNAEPLMHQEGVMHYSYISINIDKMREKSCLSCQLQL